MVDVYSFGVLLAFLFTGKHSPVVPPDVQVRTRRLNTRLSPIKCTGHCTSCLVVFGYTLATM
jgi:hypothetical protein